MKVEIGGEFAGYITHKRWRAWAKPVDIDVYLNGSLQVRGNDHDYEIDSTYALQFTYPIRTNDVITVRLYSDGGGKVRSDQFKIGRNVAAGEQIFMPDTYTHEYGLHFSPKHTR